MRLLIFNLWHKKETIHTLTKRIKNRTTDNNNNDNNNNNSNSISSNSNNKQLCK